MFKNGIRILKCMSLFELTRYFAAYWTDKSIRLNVLTTGGLEREQNETFKNKYRARVIMEPMVN